MPAVVNERASMDQLRLYNRYRADIAPILKHAEAFRDWIRSVGVKYPYMEAEDMHGGWVFNTSYGLCNSLYANGIVQICSKSWPEYSGDSAYPVPSVPAKYGALSVSEAYWAYDHKYLHEYGALRLSLLDHIIKLLAATVAELDDELLTELLTKE